MVYSSSAYIASAFNALNLASLINVVLYVVETVLLPFYAKLADNLGRTESFAISIFFYVLSGIIQACAPNMGTLVVNFIPFFLYAFSSNFYLRAVKLFMLLVSLVSLSWVMFSLQTSPRPLIVVCFKPFMIFLPLSISFLLLL